MHHLAGNRHSTGRGAALNRRFSNKNKRALRYSQFGLIRHVRTCESVKLWSPRSLGINSPADISKAELASMLPGFRFLFAAIVLSMSILVFGLGAAALLRAAHEEFANLPSRRAPPQPMFARQNDDAPPMLALLRVDPPVAEKPAENVPAAVPAATADTAAPAGQAPAEPEKLAAVTPAEPMQVEAAKSETPAAPEASAETPVAPPP